MKPKCSSDYANLCICLHSALYVQTGEPLDACPEDTFCSIRITAGVVPFLNYQYTDNMVDALWYSFTTSNFQVYACPALCATTTGITSYQST